MKRGCLLIFVAVLLVLFMGGAFAVYRVNSNYGVFEAEAIPYITHITENTRIQVVLQTDEAIPLIKSLLPDELEGLPGSLPWSPEEIAEMVLPREASILAGSNYETGQLDVTLFANERRLGPALVSLLNQEGALASIEGVNWSSAGFTVPRRGEILAVGTVALAGNAESQIQNYFPSRSHEAMAPLSGQHLVEAILDNRDGELLLIAMVVAGKMGIPPAFIFSDETVVGLLTHITAIQLTVNITGQDELTLKFSIPTAEDTDLAQRMALIGAVNTVIIPEVQRRATLYQLDASLDRGRQPDFVEGALEGTLVVTGWRTRVEQQLSQALAVM